MPILSPEAACELCARLLGIAVVQQSSEMLWVRRSYSATGIWPWRVLQQDSNPRLAGLLSGLLSERGLLVMHGLRVLAGLSLLCCGLNVSVCYVWLSTCVTSWRWRGHFNGGSDTLTLVLSFALSFASDVFASGLLQRAALFYIAAQTVLSYFVAGVAKLKERTWRSGAALTEFAALRRYAVPAAFQRVVGHAGGARILTYGVIGFECSFPLACVSPLLTPWVLGAGLGFHVLNAWAFGLNRFWPVWLAAYPSLIYVSQVLARGW